MMGCGLWLVMVWVERERVLVVLPAIVYLHYALLIHVTRLLGCRFKYFDVPSPLHPFVPLLGVGIALRLCTVVNVSALSTIRLCLSVLAHTIC